MARKPIAPKVRRKKKSPMMFIMLIAPAALVLLPIAIVFIIGMIPTFVAYVVDRDPEKSAPITVGGPNLCGCLPYVLDLWKHGHTTIVSSFAGLKVFSDPMVWLVTYGAAAVGWTLYFVIPPLVANAEIMRSERRIEALRQKKITLVQEWGPEVSGDGIEDNYTTGLM